LSVQPGLRGSNDLHVGRKMATFQLFFQSGLTKDLSAPLCISMWKRDDMQSIASNQRTLFTQSLRLLIY